MLDFFDIIIPLNLSGNKSIVVDGTTCHTAPGANGGGWCGLDQPHPIQVISAYLLRFLFTITGYLFSFEKK